jgi:hypothetical protein
MYYEELQEGEWRRLDIDGEMLTGRAHHVIYFGSRESWNEAPDWARGRRDEIIRRIKSAFPIPDYEYEGEGVLDDRDRKLLIDAASGLSSERCGWTGCANLALRSQRLCILHANRNASEAVSNREHPLQVSGDIVNTSPSGTKPR